MSLERTWLLSDIEVYGKLPRTGTDFSKWVVIWMGRNIDKDQATRHVSKERLPNIRQIASICDSLHRLANEIPEDSPFEEGAYELQ